MHANTAIQTAFRNLSGAGTLLCVGILTALSACESFSGESPPTYEAPDCQLTRTSYRVTSVDLPTTQVDVAEHSFDLDDSGERNLIGGLFATLYANFESAQEMWPGSLQTALSGEVVWLLTLDQCADDPGGYAQLGSARGVDSDGDGRFAIVDAQGRPSVGYRDGDQLVTVNGGAGEVPIGTLTDILGGHSPNWVPAQGLQSEMEITAEGELEGRIGVGLIVEAVEAATPGLRDYLNSRLQAGTSDLARLYDADEDGTITEAEFLASSLTGVFRKPDVDLMTDHGGSEVYCPGCDGIDDRLSFAIRVTAVPVETDAATGRLTPPGL